MDSIGFFSFADGKKDGEYYSFSSQVNGLFKINLDIKKETFLTSVSEYDLFSEKLFYGMQKWNDSIICIPYHSDAIFIYDLNTHTSCLHKIDGLMSNKPEFLCSFIIYNVLHIPSNYGHAIYRFDLTTNTFLPKVNITSIKTNFNCKDMVIFNGIVYMISNYNNQVICYDPISSNFDFINIDNSSGGFNGIVVYNGNLILSSRLGGCLIFIDPKSKIEVHRIVLNDNFNVVLFSRMSINSNQLILLPAFSTSFVIIDLEFETKITIPLCDKFISKGWNVTSEIKYKGKNYAFLNSISDFVSVNQNQQLIGITIDNESKEYFASQTLLDGIMHETPLFSLNNMLSRFAQGDYMTNLSDMQINYCGKIIHNVVKGAIL